LCYSPPPPIYLQRAEINGLNAGTYNLSIYFIPFGDVFPPAVIDYPIYLIDNMQFGVINGPVIVDSTTNIGLILLTFFVLLVGLYSSKKRFL